MAKKPQKGDCFRYAYNMALEKGFNKGKDFVVIHANVRPTIALVDKKSGEVARIPLCYTHAWVEMGRKVYDWQTMVRGIYRGEKHKKGVPVSKEQFYKHHNPTDVQRYTAGETLRMAFQTRNYGSWSDEERRRYKSLKKVKFGAIWSNNG